MAKSEKEILDNTKPPMITAYTLECLEIKSAYIVLLLLILLTSTKDFILGYIEALKTEIKGVQQIIKEKGYKIQNIYIGGGTPTAIDEKT